MSHKSFNPSIINSNSFDRRSFWNFHKCNELLDSESQSNIITESFCKKLMLNLIEFSMLIGGITQRVIYVKHRTSANVKSRFNNFETNL